MIMARAFWCSGATLLMLFGCVWPVLANTNPEKTLPVIEQPQPAKQSVTIETEQDPGLDSKLQRLLASTVMVGSFDVKGVKSIPMEDIDRLLQPFLGQTVTVAALVNLSRAISAYYQRQGYPLSFAYIPAQGFADQIVVIHVVEGYIGKLKLEGDFGSAAEKVRAVAQPLLQEKPLRSATMKRYSSLLGLIPGLNLQAYLPLPNNQEGMSELLIKANRQPISATGRIESLRPKAKGLISIQTAAHTALAEQLTLTALLSDDDEEYYAAAYSQMLGSSGLIFKADGAMYDGRSSENLSEQLKRDVRSLRLSTSLSYPLIADRGRLLMASVGMSAVNFADRISNRESLRGIMNKTDSRALSFSVNYSEADLKRSRSLQLDLSRGVNAFGARKSIKTNYLTAQRLRSTTDLDFRKINLALYQSNLWPKNLGTVFSLNGQYSPDALPVSERTQYGGFQYGRAFVPGYLSGDSGWGVSVEVNRMQPVVYNLSYLTITGLQPYALVEAARTYQNAEATESSDHIRSLALGVRLHSDVLGVLDLALAKSMVGRDDRKGNDLTLSFNFGFRLN